MPPPYNQLKQLKPKVPTNGDFTGVEWQNFFLEILAYMHGLDEFERVPDSYGGDFGIEAFTFAGAVYQCYADQASNTKKARYQKQRNKLTEDIRKFCENAQGIQALLGAQKVRRWHFVVPRLEHKDLLKHARAKTQEVRSRNLPHVANDFEIVILDRQKLAPWERQLEKTRLKLRIRPLT